MSYQELCHMPLYYNPLITSYGNQIEPKHLPDLKTLGDAWDEEENQMLSSRKPQGMLI